MRFKFPSFKWGKTPEFKVVETLADITPLPSDYFHSGPLPEPTPPVRIWDECGTCGGLFGYKTLSLQVKIRIFAGETEVPHLKADLVCARCHNGTQYTLQYVCLVSPKGHADKVEEVDDERFFSVKEGWLQERNDAGEDLATTENYDLIYYSDCGCEREKPSALKNCPSCSKAKGKR